MSNHPTEKPQAQRARLLREANELVNDPALPCDLCRRRMHYFPANETHAHRCFGRGWDWRCFDCTLSPLIVSATLFGDAITPLELLTLCRNIGYELMGQFKELRGLKPSPLVDDALQVLCIQMQLIGEAIELHEESIALGNLIVLERYRPSKAGFLPASRDESPTADDWAF